MSKIMCIFSFATENTEKTLVKEVSVVSVPLWQNCNLILLKYLFHAYALDPVRPGHYMSSRAKLCVYYNSPQKPREHEENPV